MRHLLASSLFLLCVVAPAAAQDGDAKARKPDPAKEQTSRTRHAVVIGGSKIEYEATAGLLPLKGEDGKLTANVFYVAYTKLGADPARRPVTFCFNGGPGSSSVWLHLGAFGPKRVRLTPKGEPLPPPARLVPNEWSILDLTDLVFIDPVSTGYSRAADAKGAKQFHGVEEDVQSVGEFIRLFVTRHERWRSPIFLAGESYGTTRAASLANHLQNRHGLYPSGVLLISSVLNFLTIRMDAGNNLPYALFLPAYTATAWYHKQLPPDLQKDLKKALAEAERFALTEYNVALMKGTALTDAERQAVAKKLARLTGLSEQYVLRTNLRIETSRFRRELLRERGLTVGRFDSRLTGRDFDDAAEYPSFDVSYAAVQGPFTVALNQYLRGELKFESDLNYEILTGRVQPWNYGRGATNRYLNVAPALAEALAKNPYLRVFAGNGLYDLATPYSATDYTFHHLGPDRALRDRVTLTYYEAGHMMYTFESSLRQLKQDISRFYAEALASKAASGE